MKDKRSKTLRVLRSPQRYTRSVAEKVEVYLPPGQWTPGLIEDVARLLADAVVRDLRQYPVPQSEKAS